MATYSNRIRALRVQKGLTQQELSSRTGMALEKIQRAEAGVWPVFIAQALEIAAYFETPLDKVFPSAKRTLAKLARNGASLMDLLQDDEKYQLDLLALEEAGLDFEPRRWTLKAWLRPGATRCFKISGATRRRIWKLLQSSDEPHTFAVFDTETCRVAINRRHLIGFQFLWDALIDVPTQTGEHEGCQVFLSDRHRPVRFGVDDDTKEIGPEENDGPPSQLQDIFLMLEVAGQFDDHLISFVDEDGEHVFWRAAEVTVIEVPLRSVEPKLADAEYEGWPADPESLEGDGERPQLTQAIQ